MVPDDTKTAFSSTWEIDKQVVTDTIAGITATDTLLVPAPIPDYPQFDFEIQFKPNGYNRWYRSGGASLTNNASNQIVVFGYLRDGALWLRSNTPGTVRYFIYADKVNY